MGATPCKGTTRVFAWNATRFNLYYMPKRRAASLFSSGKDLLFTGDMKPIDEIREGIEYDREDSNRKLLPVVVIISLLLK